MFIRHYFWLVALCGIAGAGASAQDEVFSGLQVGEQFTPFAIRGAVGDQSGKERTVFEKSDGHPMVAIFVHEVNRPSVGLTRILGNYLATLEKTGLESAIVFLSDDATETENWMKRAQQALPKGVPLGISVDGREGPGAYGLNRNVTMTILVGKDNKVTANFALVQPSLQADAPRVAKAIVDAVGGEKVPTLDELLAGAGERMARPATDNLELRQLVSPLIQRDASQEEVEKAASRIEEQMEKDPNLRRRIGQIAQTIVRSGKLENYGTAAAQAYLKTWAEKFGPPER